MAIVSVRIPQIGEGLQEARLVGVLKQPGEFVKRDEPIYQMETDKAVMDVESPYEGILTEWLAEPDTILPIGAEVARMEVAGVTDMTQVAPPAELNTLAGATTSAARNSDIPPRTRAYAHTKGISDEALGSIPRVSAKLMPEDIDRYLTAAPSDLPLTQSDAFDQAPLPPAQRRLASRLTRGTQSVVQGTIAAAVNWEPIERERERVQSSGDSFKPSAFTMFAFAVTQALKNHPLLRSSMVGNETLRTYRNVDLGIAVSLPGDELVLAVVDKADTMSWRRFAETMREQIGIARTGIDQATEAVTISLTNMQSFGLRDAIPVVVAPCVATLFIGEIYNGLAQDTDELRLQRSVNLALSFDHRVINGVGASEFLKAVKQNVETISSILV